MTRYYLLDQDKTYQVKNINDRIRTSPDGQDQYTPIVEENSTITQYTPIVEENSVYC